MYFTVFLNKDNDDDDDDDDDMHQLETTILDRIKRNN